MQCDADPCPVCDLIDLIFTWREAGMTNEEIIDMTMDVLADEFKEVVLNMEGEEEAPRVVH